MKTFLFIYRYELVKILRKRSTVIFLILITLITVVLNLNTIPLYSAGRMGAAIDNPGAVLGKIPFRYIDDNGELVEEDVSALKYIKLQREYALKWKGHPLDDSTIKDMQEFLNKYRGMIPADEDYNMAYLLQNYYWVFRSIYNLGLNPWNENLTEESLKTYMNRAWDTEYDNQELTEKEKLFWDEHEPLEYPIIIDYAPAYGMLINYAFWIHFMLIVFVIIALGESFSLEKRRNTKQVMQTTPKGFSSAVYARFLAGETVAVSAALLLYGISMIIQFSVLGSDGYSMPLQQQAGFSWSRLMISSGDATLLLFVSSIIIIVSVAALTMMVSELSQNVVVSVGVMMAVLMVTMAIDIPVFGLNRNLSQVWAYLPLQRIRHEFLYDERLVSFGNNAFPAIPFSNAVYVIVLLLSFILCVWLTVKSRRENV